jgi:hypothetical protein
VRGEQNALPSLQRLEIGRYDLFTTVLLNSTSSYLSTTLFSILSTPSNYFFPQTLIQMDGHSTARRVQWILSTLSSSMIDLRPEILKDIPWAYRFTLGLRMLAMGLVGTTFWRKKTQFECVLVGEA